MLHGIDKSANFPLPSRNDEFISTHRDASVVRFIFGVEGETQQSSAVSGRASNCRTLLPVAGRKKLL